MNQHIFAIGLLALLIAFAIYRRVRRNIGWQLLSPRRLRVRTGLFLAVGLWFLSAGLLHPVSLASDIAGIAIGAALAYYGIGLTRYEQVKGTWHYKPNTWIGSAVIVLFLGRLAYRFYRMYTVGLPVHAQAYQPGDVPNIGAGGQWSAGLLMILFTYYVVYYVLLLRREKALRTGAGQV